MDAVGAELVELVRSQIRHHTSFSHLFTQRFCISLFISIGFWYTSVARKVMSFSQSALMSMRQSISSCLQLKLSWNLKTNCLVILV